MGVRANGDPFTAQFFIETENISTWIGVSKSIADAACVTFQAFSIFNKKF
jgi:hypothetical protein